MTVLLSILGKYWPYLAGVLVVATSSGWLVHKADSTAYARLQAAYSGYQAKVADQAAADQEAARKALQKQIDTHHAIDQNNQVIIDDLTKRTAEAQSHYDADRRFISGMLNTASRAPSPSGNPVPSADHHPEAAPASGTDGTEQVAELCASTKAEDQLNADRLDALIAQIRPQL